MYFSQTGKLHKNFKIHFSVYFKYKCFLNCHFLSPPPFLSHKIYRDKIYLLIYQEII